MRLARSSGLNASIGTLAAGRSPRRECAQLFAFRFAPEFAKPLLGWEAASGRAVPWGDAECSR
jgi:hypothetical protein